MNSNNWKNDSLKMADKNFSKLQNDERWETFGKFMECITSIAEKEVLSGPVATKASRLMDRIDFWDVNEYVLYFYIKSLERPVLNSCKPE